MNAALPSRPLSDLKGDNQGAIMMTGLFMSCFLIGSLWFVIGIGDTIVFRDKMQEAADVGAFSSAALHAKGLNFISLCNLVLLAAVTIHIILGIIHDIALAICIVSAIFTLGFGCTFWVTMERIWSGYFRIMKPAAQAIAAAEKVVAFSYPALGLIEGLENGRTYGGGRGTSEVTVLPLSASLIPGGGKSGLPVTPQPMNYLCVKLANVTGKLIDSALSFAPSAAKKAIDMVMGWIGKGIQFRYCNSLGGGTGQLGDAAQQEARNKGQQKIDDVNKEIDKQNANNKDGDPDKDKIPNSNSGGGGSAFSGIDPGFDSFWGKDGPMTVFSKGANGSAYFATYAVNVAPSINDESESRVGIGRGTKLGMEKYTKPIRTPGYFAQAEFYFDCKENWAADSCNNSDNATFQIKWRARLKKFSVGKTADSILNIGLTGLANVGRIEDLKNDLGNLTGKAGALVNGGGVTGAGDLVKAFDQFKGDAQDTKNAFSSPSGIAH
jgi:hypothetical protein